jgi:demethylmenaquinone methyltransferase/2-methoxy-6-polyprenyl-1,4-benzoquinol methylase
MVWSNRSQLKFRLRDVAKMDPPHPPLRTYYAGAQSRSGWVRDIFSRTAGDYDRVERAMAIGTGSWYRRRALLQAGLEGGMTVVDVGVGTGLVAREAANIVGDPACVIGVDPSPGMVANARVPNGVRLISGSAEHLPVPAATVDFVSMGFALRHVEDLATAFAEFYRVLKPGGRLCVLEITRPVAGWARALLKFYLRRVVPWMAARLASHRDTPELMRYYYDTIEACVAPEAVMAALRVAGFGKVVRNVEMGIFSAYGAQKPAR